MKEVEKIRAYIGQNPIPRPDLDELSLTEASELSHALGMTFMDAVILAYDYGRAKGYQIARTERDKGGGGQ